MVQDFVGIAKIEVWSDSFCKVQDHREIAILFVYNIFCKLCHVSLNFFALQLATYFGLFSKNFDHDKWY